MVRPLRNAGVDFGRFLLSNTRAKAFHSFMAARFFGM
jgi:hypothetical protein